MRLTGYVRVSRVAGRKGDGFISPKVQRERIEAVAAAGGHTIVEIVEDLDQSGAKADRPGFQKILSNIEAGRSDGIVVAKLDRFSRSVSDAAHALKRIDEAGGAFLSAEDSLDTSTPMGRFALHMMLAIAELEWERRRESWEIARANAVERGIHVASRTPTGYDRDEDRRLIPNRYASKITEAFRRRAQGASWRELSDLMEGVPTPYGATSWTTRSVAELLENRVYLGEARSGKFVNPDAHEPLTDPGTFQLASRREQRRSIRRDDPSLLSGLIRCGGCSYAIKPDRMKLRDGSTARIYRCRGQRAMGRCESAASVMARIIEPWVEAEFLSYAEVIAAAPGQDRREIEVARAERDEAIAQRDAFLSLEIEDITIAQAELDRRQERVEAAEAHLSDLLAGAEGMDTTAIVEAWPDLTIPEKREILTGSIDVIFLRRSPNRANIPIGDRALILWRGEGPAGLPGPGRKMVPLTPYNW
jgi:site-specific DNA recombinase